MTKFSQFDPYKAEHDRAAHQRGIEAKQRRAQVTGWSVRPKLQDEMHGAQLRKAPITLSRVAFLAKPIS